MAIFSKYTSAVAAAAAAAATTTTAPNSDAVSTSQSIRGKISAPIPLSDDEWNPGSGIVATGGANAGPSTSRLSSLNTVQHSQSSQQPSQISQSSFQPSQPVQASSDTGRSSRRTESTASPSRRATDSADSPNRNTYRHSTVSAMSRGTGNGRDMPQRKKSTLRTALGKLFGKKKTLAAGHGFGSHDNETPSPVGPSSQHRSDPSALKRPSIIAEDEPKRSSSLPITEFDRALRSHSVGPDDITVIESVRNSLQADLSFSRRRAVTASGRIPSYPRRRETTELAGLSPRPASAQGRASRGPHPDGDPDEIGMAITSDGQQTSHQHKRRSRSLSGLPDLADEKGGMRRRSDEIRYWRQSYDPGFTSPLLSDAPEGDDTGVVSLDLPASSGSQDVPRTPPQPFNFGATIASSSEMAGMRITEAASLASQMGNLEVRIRKVEQQLVRILHQTPHRRDPADNERREFLVTARQTQTQTQTQTPRPTLGKGSTPSSPHSPTPSLTTRISFDDAQAAHVRSPIIHGAASLPVLSISTFEDPASSTPVSVSTNQYNTLLALLRTEQSERHELASQLRWLERRFSALSGAATSATIGRPTMESFGGGGDNHCNNARQSSAFGREPGADDSGVTMHGVGDDREDYDQGSNVPEEFFTPREEKPTLQVFGAFGEELRETKGGGGKKAARTLSLSQLTRHTAAPEQA